MSDLDLNEARTLLDGFVAQGRRHRQKYLKEGSPEELDARRALTRILRSPDALDRGIRESLAALLDPDPPEWEQRKIRVVNRRRKLIDHIAKTQVYEEVKANMAAGSGVNAAIGRAAAKFSISEEMTKRIWRNYSAIYGRR
jgi:hypothetical protein